MRRRLALTFSSEKARAFAVVCFCASVAAAVVGMFGFAVTNQRIGHEADRVAHVAYRLGEENRRLLSLEHPTDAQLRARIDNALAKLTRAERERLLRLLLSAVPPQTLQALVEAGNLAPAAAPPRPPSASHPVPRLMPPSALGGAPSRKPTQHRPSASPTSTSPAPGPPPAPSRPPPQTPPPVPLLPLPHVCLPGLPCT